MNLNIHARRPECFGVRQGVVAKHVVSAALYDYDVFGWLVLGPWSSLTNERG